MRRLIAACVGLATVSLLLPSQPTYDPWAWLVWGREVDFLKLNTTGGPSFKPFPVALDALFAPFGKIDDGIPPALWLVFARAAALLALALAFRLASRLAGGGLTGAFAGALATIGLALTPLWLRYMGHGNEAPIAVAFVLWAIERHLDGARHQAFILGILACLLRPEVFPFLVLYAIYVWRVEPERRVLIAAGMVILPALWIVPEWISSGNPLTGEQRATGQPSWSLSRRPNPWWEALKRANGQTGPALEVGALIGFAAAVIQRNRTAIAFGVVVIAWAAMFSIMTQVGFSGNARYFLPALPLIAILAGYGAATLVKLGVTAGARLGARAAPAAGVAAAALILAVLVPVEHVRVDHFRGQARKIGQTAKIQSDLHKAVQAVGGPEAIIAQGAPTVNRAYETRLAWELKLSIHDVEKGRDKGVVFRTAAGSPKPLSRAVASRRVLTRVGKWTVFGPPTPLTASSRSPQQ